MAETAFPRERLSFDWLARPFLLLFAAKPIFDLEIFSFTQVAMLGQRINLAAVFGLAFLFLPLLPLLDRPIQRRTAVALGWLGAMLLFSAMKAATGFHDLPMLIRFISCSAILAFIVYRLDAPALPPPVIAVAFLSVGAIVLIALLQVGGIVEMLSVDRIDSHQIGRVTGGYGHPLSFSRVLSFGLLYVLYSFHRSEVERRRWAQGATLLAMALMAFCVFRSTYRTGILFLFLSPLTLLAMTEAPWIARFRQIGIILAVILGSFYLASTPVLRISNLFGHSGGFVGAPVLPPPVSSRATPFPAPVEIPVMQNEQVLSIGRGRGAKWMVYGEALKKSTATEWLIGHRGTEVAEEGREFNEPHNMLILSVYVFGVLGTLFLAGSYFWTALTVLRFTGRGSAPFIVAAFLTPLWFGLVSEPWRYPTFFTMLFLTVALIRGRDLISDARPSRS